MTDAIKRNAFASPAFLVIGLALTPLAWSAQYTSGQGIEATAEYTDNVRLVPDDETELHGVVISPEFSLTRRSERMEAKITADFDFARYNHSRFDSDDQALRAGLDYRWEQTRLNLDARATRNSTRTSELQDTGRIGEEATRKERYALDGAIEQQLDPRNAATGALNYSTTHYESNALSDFDVLGASLGWIHRYSERVDLRSELYFSRFETDERPQVESDTFGLRVGGDYALNETLTFSLRVGGARVETEHGPGSAREGRFEENAYTLDSALDYRLQRHRLIARAARATEPSGDGVLKKSDRLSLDYRYRLAPQASLETTLTWLQSEAIDDPVADERDYASLQLGYRRQLSETWSLATRLRHQYQRREAESGHAEANSVQLELRYSPRETDR